ncbi:Virulence sensor protein BvgS precursor [Candidatus Venteria ishoeyi]|uniref:Virulence sensor protein BvgS n=2 Tax=Candidatus Venteria ishoeyi TaxID=1899563 RepID=A0A1H6FBI2_9GAMM|nr:Virulence sensor protein BvgS precursor [Candidatus Venteria ishoeyi]
MTTMTTKQMPQILIVDDNQNNLFTLRSLLTEHISAEVIEADSGEKALNIILQQVIDLIILDVQMPGMDGFETARILGSIKKPKIFRLFF